MGEQVQWNTKPSVIIMVSADNQWHWLLCTMGGTLSGAFGNKAFCSSMHEIYFYIDLWAAATGPTH